MYLHIQILSAAAAACDGGQVTPGSGCMFFTMSAGQQQVAFQQHYLNAQSIRGTSGQRKRHSRVSTTIRCITYCSFQYVIFCIIFMGYLTQSGWWHHVVTPSYNIPERKEIFLRLCEPHLLLMLQYQHVQLQGNRPLLRRGCACCLRAASQAAK